MIFCVIFNNPDIKSTQKIFVNNCRYKTRKIRQIFKKFDKDGSGELDKKDVALLLKENLRNQGTIEEYDEDNISE